MSVQLAPSPRRSLLFLPGDSLRKMEKAAGWEVDTVILDLEDGVAQNLVASSLRFRSLMSDK